MDYDSLKVFVHLSDTLHYGKTSRACNLSPSTLSRVIKRLEDRLGKQLFERDNRSVQLTTAGKQFRKYAKDALVRWHDFQNSLARKDAVLTGEISMYCTVTASYSVLPEILVQFRKSYPEVNIKLLTGDSESAIRKVVAGDADFAVAALPDRTPGKLCFEPITTIHLQFVGPVIPWPYMDRIKKKSIPWDRIPMIVAEKGMARKRIDAWFRSKNTKPNIYAQVSGNESILAMVSLGFGVGIVPQLVLEKNIINRDVKVLDVQPKIKPYSVGICVQKRRIRNPLVNAFWEIIHNSDAS
jgi:LysR family positive regulator for ilvC